MKKYNLVCCGGTFDHLHKGHREFLKFAFSKGERVLIGIVTDKYVKEKKPLCLIEDYRARKKSVESFLVKENLFKRSLIIELNDIYGPTLSKKIEIDAILVSEKTKEGAKKINEERKKSGLAEIKILVKEAVKGFEDKIISSSLIRAGIINREGVSYLNRKWLNKKLKLTENLRLELKKPMGFLCEKEADIAGKINPGFLITVGDISTKYFTNREKIPKISIVDFMVKRRKKFSSFSQLGFSGRERILRIRNEAGFLTPELFLILEKIFSFKTDLNFLIKVKGEEDLSVLPVLLRAPLGFSIFYGQPGEGMIRVEATEDNKKKAYEIVSQFEQLPCTRGY